MASQEFQEDASKQLKMVQYPLDSNSYQILSKIGHGSSAVVYKAICLPVNSSVVAIKAIDLDRSKADLDSVRRETKIMSLLYHPNILRAHCSFTVERSLWVVMPFMSGGSLQSIITTAYPDGLLETCIAIILKEILCALAYLHDNGHLHRDVKAGNILIDSAGSVKLADFGVSASLYESNSSNDSWASSSSSLMLRDVTGTPYWMAPEVIHSHVGYSFKADIWSFGITALELARGRPPLSHLPPSKSLIMNITKRFRLSDYENNQKSKNKKFSKSFKEMVGSCLDQDPSKRPSAEKLLKHPFFRGCKGPEFLVKNMLQGLPSVEQRFIEAKHRTPVPLIRTEDDDDEEPLPGEIVKQRRISGWNFNEDGLELEPVFPPDDEVKGLPKEECFGGEKCILEMIDSSGESISGSSVAAAENPQTGGGENQASEDAENSGGEAAENVSVGGGNREVVIRSLLVLKQSLDDQRQRVASMISLLRGEEIRSREDELNQVIENLRMELESERRKNFELETTLELLKKLHLSGE